MKQVIRYSSSALTSILLSLMTFLGMTWLIASPKPDKLVSVDPVEFTMINDMDKTEPNKPSPPRTPPKLVKVTRPPAAPNIEMSETHDPTPGPRVITGIGKPELTTFTKFATPNVLPSADKQVTDQDLIVLLPFMPQYPIKQLNNKIEGWVKVEFVVNKLGKATQIKVIDAKPKRVFDQATIRAIRKSKFKPLHIDGKAVSQTAVQTIEFKLLQE